MNTILMCKVGFEAALCDEVVVRTGIEAVARNGYVRSEGSLASEFVFESMRMDGASVISFDRLKPISDQTLAQVFESLNACMKPWSMELFAPGGDEESGALRRIKGIGNTLLRLLGKKNKPLASLYRKSSKPGRMALLLCLTDEGMWYALREEGGLPSYRMKMDDDAPSRSYLKMEEAFVRMDEYPEAGQRVIDLGAAPGGWTYAFLKRGAHVLAVDHGPLKLNNYGTGAVEHFADNGLTFEAPAGWEGVDWLVSDMLVAPGVALGLIRRWMDGGQAKRVVCNMKIPQQQPYVAIKPLLEYLAQKSDWQVSVKQLYHDRREVTVMGRWMAG